MLNPDKQLSYSGFFLNSLWSNKNSVDLDSLELLERGAIELQDFLAGEDFKGFKAAEQPKVLEFITKLLKAAKLLPDSVLGPGQKQNPQLLNQLFVGLGQNSARFHLNGGDASSQTFLGTLWNAAVKDERAISKGVQQLGQYLRDYGLTIDSLSYLSKMQLAFSYLGKYLGADFEGLLRDIYQNLGTILAISGVIGGLLFSPAGPFVAAVLAILDIIFTALLGIETVKGLFDFFVAVHDAKDEAGIERAAQELAHAIGTGAGTVLGVAGLFKSVATLADEGPKLINAIQRLFKLAKSGFGELPAVAKFFTQFGQNKQVLAFVVKAIRNVKQGGVERLWAFAAYLSRHEQVFNLLAGLLDKDSRLLDDVLKIGPNAIDDLDVILAKGATAEQILKLRFEVRGMSIAELRKLLEIKDMAPVLLTKLFDVPGMSILELKKLLRLKDMTPSLLVELFKNTSFTTTELRTWIAKLRTNQVLDLSRKYGGDAMKHYGADWFKVYRGIDADTTAHVTVGHGTGGGQVKGCHDTDNFENQFVNSIPPKTIVHTRTLSGIYTKYRYNLVTSTGGTPKPKTTRQDLAKDWPRISTDLTNIFDGMIRAKTFPVGQTASPIVIQYEGVKWEFRFGSNLYNSSGNHIRTIYPNI